VKIVFFGTSPFSARILAYLLENQFAIAAIVTQPSRPQGRSLEPVDPPVKCEAKRLSLNIPLFQPEQASSDTFASILREFQADLFVVVAYGEIIKKNLLEMPKKGCINVHASLLPKYRGAAPIQRALMAGEEESGITIMYMAPKMDAGDIITTASLKIPEEMNSGELSDKLCALACPLLKSVLEQLERGDVERTIQDHEEATFAPKITPLDTEIQWDKKAQEIHNQIRALSPTPGAWCWVHIGSEKKRLKIYRSKISEKGVNAFLPKRILCYGKEGWIVATGEGALELLEVQLEGKKKISAQEFIRGFPQPVL
jgi:methionyl-tRNA formyltransferase